jgi:hypothetical protein
VGFNTVDYMQDGTGAGPSRGVWADFGEEKDLYAEIMDDFLVFIDQVSTEDHGGYRTYMDTNVTCVQQKTQQGGVIMLDTIDADNEEGAITLGDSGILGAVVTTAGSNKKLWFETRVKFSDITAQSAYVGLAGANSPADGLLADAGTTIASKNLLGFNVLEASPSALNAVYDTASSLTTLKSAAQTMVAGTWYKLGIRYDGTTIHYYVDGSIVASIAASADNVPDGVYLAPLWALKAHESDDKNLSIDWWRFGIER